MEIDLHSAAELRVVELQQEVRRTIEAVLREHFARTGVLWPEPGGPQPRPSRPERN